MTSSSVTTLPVGTVGIDRSASIQSQAPALLRAGYAFAMRTVALPGPDGMSQGILTAGERDAIFAAGLALGLYQPYRNKSITADQGLQDGKSAALQAQELGCPIGADPPMTLWCDLEGSFQGPDGKPVSADTMITYLQNWATAVTNLGYAPGLYIGGQNLLSSSQITSITQFAGFWQAGGYIPAITRGYQMYQLHPLDIVPPGIGINVDVDVLQQDFSGRSATFWRGG